MSRFAEQTTVSSDKSRAEIERLLRRYGASAFVYGWESDRAQIGFTIANRSVRFSLLMPNPSDDEFRFTPQRRIRRTAVALDAAYEQAVRQRWRALALVIKAKLEAVAAGITTVEAEFMAHIALPSGATVGEWVAPQLERAYSNGDMPALLPGGKS